MGATLLDRPSTQSANGSAQRLRTITTAVRVSFTWLGVRKSLTSEQKAQAAESFGAEGQFLSAGKKLLDTRDPAYRAVTAVRHRCISYWRGVSLPYPEPGVRLIRQDRVAEFDRQLRDFREELNDAVVGLDERYERLKSAARDRLGSLYDPADYPESLHGLFGVDWEFPAVEPPDYLQQLNPEIFEQERARVAGRFEEAVQLAEQAFMEEFQRVVAHLCERIGGDGEKKVFRDSVVGNLKEFFDRFRQLNVRSNPDLDALVDEAQRAVRGVDAQSLRDHADLRQLVSLQLQGVQSALDDLLVDRPRRRILRSSPAGSADSGASA